MRINLSFDASVSNASSRWIESVKQAATFLDAIISDPITVNFQIGYGEVEGQELGAGVLGVTSNDIGYNVSYGQLVAALEKHPTSLLDQQFLSTLPQVDPNNGQTWFVPSAEAKALGLVPATSNTIDAYVGFNDSLPLYYGPNRTGIPSDSTDLIGVALHELTHALGRALGPNKVEAMNLMTYGSNGLRDLNNSQMRFISYDNGQTSIGTLDATSDPSDLAQGSPTNDPFDAYLSSGVDYVWTATDTAVMEMLGYHVNTGLLASSASFVSADALGSASLNPHDFALATANAPRQAAVSSHYHGSGS